MAISTSGPEARPRPAGPRNTISPPPGTAQEYADVAPVAPPLARLEESHHPAERPPFRRGPPLGANSRCSSSAPASGSPVPSWAGASGGEDGGALGREVERSGWCAMPGTTTASALHGGTGTARPRRYSGARLAAQSARSRAIRGGLMAAGAWIVALGTRPAPAAPSRASGWTPKPSGLRPRCPGIPKRESPQGPPPPQGHHR